MDFPLVDGAMLVVTTSRAADRLGREYDGPIQPDQPVETDWTRVGSDDDPVIRAATGWLGEQGRAARRELDEPVRGLGGGDGGSRH